MIILIVVRLGYGLVATRVDPFLKKNPLYGDATNYDEAAWQFAQTNEIGVKTTPESVGLHEYRAPLYSVIVGTVYKVIGHRPQSIRMLQAIWAIISVGLFFVSCRHLFGERVGLWFLGLAIIQPQLLQTSGWLYTECLLILLLAVWFLLHLKGLRDGFTPRLAIVTGVVLGMLSLTRPTFLPVTFLYVMWLAFQLRQKRRVIVPVIILLFAGLVIAPWTYRNERVYGGFVPVALSGLLFVMANNPLSHGSAMLPPDPWWIGDREVHIWAESKDMSILEKDAYLNRLGMEWLAANPEKIPQLEAEKYYLTLSPVGYSEAGKKNFRIPMIAVRLAEALFILYVAISLRGYGLARRRYKTHFVPFTYLSVTLLLVAGVFSGSTRYLLPLAPFLLMFFCAVLAKWRPEPAPTA